MTRQHPFINIKEKTLSALHPYRQMRPAERKQGVSKTMIGNYPYEERKLYCSKNKSGQSEVVSHE